MASKLPIGRPKTAITPAQRVGSTEQRKSTSTRRASSSIIARTVAGQAQKRKVRSSAAATGPRPASARLPPILWQTEVLFAATLTVKHQGKTRMRGVSCMPVDARWMVVGFESAPASAETMEAHAEEFLASHAHQFLGVFDSLEAGKKAGTTFLHALCDDHTSPLSECGCEAIA